MMDLNRNNNDNNNDSNNNNNNNNWGGGQAYKMQDEEEMLKMTAPVMIGHNKLHQSPFCNKSMSMNNAIMMVAPRDVINE
jgi:hypothetical protein